MENQILEVYHLENPRFSVCQVCELVYISTNLQITKTPDFCHFLFSGCFFLTSRLVFTCENDFKIAHI